MSDSIYYNVSDEEGTSLFKIRTSTQIQKGDILRMPDGLPYVVASRILDVSPDERMDAYTCEYEAIPGQMFACEVELVVRWYR